MDMMNRRQAKTKRRSPLKSKPLRQAGQSLDEEIIRIEDDILTKYGIYAAFFLSLIGYEWLIYFTGSRPNPYIVTVIGIIVIIYCAWRFFQQVQRLRALRIGRDGEKVVGEYLDRLREKGMAIFHDVQGENFNIDHVLVGEWGIFAVETKTWSKPMRGSPKIVFDGETILAGGQEPLQNPVTQVIAVSKWLAHLLEESTGKNFPVKGVVLFPGWYVQSHSGSGGKNVWVLNPKALPKYLDNSPKVLSSEDMHLIAFHLARYIRAT